jgi:hypothetical protein
MLCIEPKTRRNSNGCGFSSSLAGMCPPWSVPVSATLPAEKNAKDKSALKGAVSPEKVDCVTFDDEGRDSKDWPGN